MLDSYGITVFSYLANSASSIRMVPLICFPRHGQSLRLRSQYLSCRTYPHIFTVNRDEFVAPIPEAERHDVMLAYHAQLNSVDDQTRITAAKAWSKWESVLFALTNGVSESLIRPLKNVNLKAVRRPRTRR